MNELALVEVKEGKLATTSLLVAEKFEKEHKDVLKKIDMLIEGQPEFTQRNFAPSEYVDNSGKANKMYIMTEEGFAMIAMRFTGKKAEEWQIKFITAFQTLRTQLATPALHSDKVAMQIAQWEAHCKANNVPDRTRQEGLLTLQGLSPALLGKPPKPTPVPPGVYPNPPKPPKGVDWRWKWVKDPDGDAELRQKVDQWWNHQTLQGHTNEQKVRGKWEIMFTEGFLEKSY